MMDLDKQLELIKRGAVEIIPEKELATKLKKSIKTNTPLKIKTGFDPSAPDLHLGHTIPFRKLQNFIDCGHKIIVIIGDYTAMIGDPTGKSKTRKQLSEEEVKKNARTYIDQVSKVLDISKVEIVSNSKWLNQMDLKNIIELTSKQTVARLLERDDFFNRYKKGDDISMVEFIYPLLVAYDSVFLKSDIEVGGTDQKFNMLLGRTIQKKYGQEGQVVLTMPLLEGIDGVEKMSKSLGNYIGITENSKDMFGKIMSLPDELILKYMELLTDIPQIDIDNYKKDMGKERNPRDIKIILAKEIVTQYYDKTTAEKEKENFNLSFSEKNIQYANSTHDAKDKYKKNSIVTSYNITSTAAEFENMNLSGTAIKRLITQGAVLINDLKVTDLFEKIKIEDDIKIKIGKKKFCLLKIDK